jgi:hypothetical protein
MDAIVKDKQISGISNQFRIQARLEKKLNVALPPTPRKRSGSNTSRPLGMPKMKGSGIYNK